MPVPSLTVYDAPQALIAQAFEGEFNLSTAGRTFTDPASLTLEERSTIADRLKKASGDTRVGNALIEVMTNPWVWFTFLTTPIGEKPVGDLFRLAKQYTGYVAKNVPMLGSIGALTSTHAIEGTRSLAAVEQFSRGKVNFLRNSGFTDYMNELESVVRKNGLSEEHLLDWSKYTPGPQQETARELAFALHAKLEGWDQPITRTVQRLENGVLTSKVEKVDRLINMDPILILNKYGAGGLVDKSKEVFNYTGKTVFSDPDAVMRLWAHSRTSGNANDGMSRALINDFMDAIGGENGLQGSADEFRQAIQTHYLDPIQSRSHYFPANTYRVVNQAPKTQITEQMMATMRASNSVTPLRWKGAHFDTKDLEYAKELFGSTDALDNAIKMSEGYAKKIAKTGEVGRFRTVNPVEATGKHLDDMSRTYAMFVQDVGDEVRRIDSSLIGTLKPSVEGSVATHRRGFEAEGASLSKTMTELAASNQVPAGGWSIADVLYADYGVAQNSWMRDTIGKIVIPRMMGRQPIESTFKVALIANSKRAMQSFLDTDAAKMMGASGDFGNNLITKMSKWAGDTEHIFEEGQALESFMVKNLYAGALGFNVPSAVINLTQPFTFAGSWLGLKPVLEGYADATKEMGAYLDLRWKQGFKPISTAERADLIRKTHKFANYEGTDLLEIAGDALESLEGKIHRSLIGENKVHSTASRVFFEYPMALFTKAEMLNRNVAAHAAYKSAVGRGMGEGIQMADHVKRFVRETQFGSHWMNTPQMFLQESGKMGYPTGRFLANPLLRQFLTFPMRSFAAWTYTGPRLGGRSGSQAFAGFVNDTMRGIGISALGYELAKELGGVDMSRAGFVGAVTDIIPGISQGRIDERDAGSPAPLPPVLDIPLDTIKSAIAGDAELFARTVSRVVPAGVAIQRALGYAPKLSPIIQNQYAGWGQRQADGTIPIYDSEGSLLRFDSPLRMVAQATGFDLGAYRDESEAMGYLIKQREKIVEARRQYMEKVYSGRADVAEVLRRQFEEKYKVPLTVTKAQWSSFQKLKTQPRLERQLDRLPAEVRPQYESVIEGLNRPLQ